ncbi:MAG TPA: dihydrofolate reductase [Candidatus Paceibacterota bacterium]|jgi:dihydrofolate reductase|nr:dihydrofolate reductase [Candidatus Paceibacterota bacterium]
MQKKNIIMKQIEVIILVALGKKNRVIGNSATKNKMPGWNLVDDRINMSDTTKGHTVFYGRPTFETFPEKYRPLPERNNIIVTRDESYLPHPTNDRTFICTSLESTLYTANGLSYVSEGKIFCFGGGNIYKQVLSDPLIKVTKMIITEVDGDFEGDVFFPPIDLDIFRETNRVHYEKMEKRNTHDFDIVTYERKR